MNYTDIQVKCFIQQDYVHPIITYEKWLQDRMPESTEQISELILQILYHGIADFNRETR